MDAMDAMLNEIAKANNVFGTNDQGALVTGTRLPLKNSGQQLYNS